MTCSPCPTANKAVEKRMLVPAAPTSTVEGRSVSHLCITSVSSQSLRLVMEAILPAKAPMAKALLLMLLEEGRTILLLTLPGDNILYCIENDY